ncbi:hypothetical protein I6A60_07570 [Frankia sp. AgB1.9]|nr:hypothetical protein [Frankia sp. AgW1.1]MBL7547730.1 hypothetical protein [Frankia sp. AgB1.9]MBL7622629.1 hypothetical protein [Frankia sp. AgB1.8]
MGVAAELRDQAPGRGRADGEPLSQVFGRDRSLVLLPVQDVLSARPMQKVLPPGLVLPGR